ncbi:A24 family peptidase [Agrobacterium sp. RAC06]|jgi:prepilin peptidase CpaA|uniref:A24 family peptidase n=1 Tax=Agrobacterium sp. RAC06 TaxID=1842536 RepID=UPI00083D69CC|nr:prepilin peptidase [Agrobacterium sp. RAC06]AOG11208.1 type IV leader peptidase family protein [Agrobacterium sp. RAC06]
MYSAIVFIVLPACLVMAALTDFLEMTIPNWISLLLIGAFVLIAPFSGLSAIELGWHLAAGLLVFIGCFSLFALNVMGGGDAKLLTAAALWFGFNTSLFEFLVYTGYLGGVLTILVMLLRANWDKLATVGVRLPQTFMIANKIPYAIAIGAAGLLAYPSSPLVVSAIQKAL